MVLLFHASGLTTAALLAPTIGISAPPRQQEYEAPSKRKFRPFGHQISFRSKSFQPVQPLDDSDLEMMPESQGHVRPAEFNHNAASARASSSSLANRNAHKASFDGGTGWPEYTFSRKSESSAPSRASGKSTLQTGGKAGSRSVGAAALFKLGRRKQPDHLFPLPMRTNAPETIQPVESGPAEVSTPASNSTHDSVTFQDPFPSSGPKTSTQRPPSIDIQSTPTFTYHTAPPTIPQDSANNGAAFGGRNDSGASTKSATSTPVVPHPLRPTLRSRSSTINSHPKRLEPDRVPTPHVQESGRSSTASTTLGRNSIAGLRSLTSKLRHSSEPHSPRYGSPGSGIARTSAKNSFALSRETLVVPEREEGETAQKYYTRIEKDIPKKSIALVLSKSADIFSHDVLRSLMRTFKFFEEPMDMSMRKFLWEIDLPGEAQQIDRVISAFAERYHECNPHIFNTLGTLSVLRSQLMLMVGCQTRRISLLTL